MMGFLKGFMKREYYYELPEEQIIPNDELSDSIRRTFLQKISAYKLTSVDDYGLLGYKISKLSKDDKIGNFITDKPIVLTCYNISNYRNVNFTNFNVYGIRKKHFIKCQTIIFFLGIDNNTWCVTFWTNIEFQSSGLFDDIYEISEILVHEYIRYLKLNKITSFNLMDMEVFTNTTSVRSLNCIDIDNLNGTKKYADINIFCSQELYELGIFDSYIEESKKEWF